MKHQKLTLLPVIFLVALISCALGTVETPVKAGNTFQLKIYHGFDFSSSQVVKYNESTPADIKFYRQTRNVGVYAYPGAAKIKEFDSPSHRIIGNGDGWNDYLFTPKTNRYYVIRSRDGCYYLLHLLKFENQGKAASYWQLTFEWKEITFDEPGNRDASPGRKAENQLTGSWGYFGDRSQPGVYIFNADGSFMHYSAVRNSYLKTGSLYAMETIYKGNYQIQGSNIVFDNVSIARFDRTKDNTNRNLIGDRNHTKEMLQRPTDFTPWTLDPVEFVFIGNGVVRIAPKDNKDEIRTTFRADWETYEEW